MIQIFSATNNNALHHGSSSLIPQNYETNSSYPHFNCSNSITNPSNRGGNSCNINNSLNSHIGNSTSNYQTTSYQSSINVYNQQQQHQTHPSMQSHHSNIQQHHQLNLHTSNSITSQGSNAVNVSINGTSSCQQQHQANYSQQTQRHQNQDRASSNSSSYSLVGTSASRTDTSSSQQNLTSGHNLNESYCQNSYVSA